MQGRVWNRIPVLFSLTFLLLYTEVLGFETEKCTYTENVLSSCQWHPTGNPSICRWKNVSVKDNYFRLESQKDEGFSLLTRKFSLSNVSPTKVELCIDFFNRVSYSRPSKFYIKVNGELLAKVLSTTILPICHPYDETETFWKVTLNASCEHLSSGYGHHISDLRVTFKHLALSTTATATTPANPTEIGDIQYVGVVVGAICIALFTLFSCLTIISARRSNQRDSRRREIQSASCPEEDDRPDVVADNAPPSYDAVMASPNMYPPTPQGSPVGTPEGTPYLTLHRRALINQHQSALSITPQSQRRSTPPATSDEIDEEQEPPPPYPGLSHEDLQNTSTDSGGRDENIDSSGTGESAREGNLPVNMARSSDHGQSDSPVNDQENNPWVLNTTGNNTRETSSRGSKPGLRNSKGTQSSNELTSSEDFSLQVRIPEPEVIGINEDHEDSPRATVSSGDILVVQDLTEPVINSDIQFNGLRNSSDNIAKSNIENGTSPISALGLV